MKITVADIAGDRLFNEADFDGLVTPDDLALLELPAYEPMDGSVFRSLPADTTHLITRIVDRLGEAELESLRDLQYVGLAYAGWWDKYFDRSALEARGVTVTNNPDYAPQAVAEAVFAGLLYEYRGLGGLQSGSLQGGVPMGRELRGRTFGMIGSGRIGKAVDSFARGVGMKTHAVSRTDDGGVMRREELLRESDVVGIFVPKSAGVVLNAKDLSMMKPDAVIVNPSGYENIDTGALREYLLRNPAARYVFLAMPEEGHFAALCDLPSARLWPLFTGSTVEARDRRREVTIANLREYLEGGGGRNRVIGGRD